MSVIKSIVYADAETRGKLRAWKKQLADKYAAFTAIYQQLASKDNRLATEMVLRGSLIGRQRAFDKIQSKLDSVARLESKSLTGKTSRAIWSIMKPRGPVFCGIDAEHAGAYSPAELASLAQNCVTVNYIVVGYLPGPPRTGIAEGLWTLEVPDHALGRAVERSRLLHPGALIREAHLNLLALPNSVLETHRAAIVDTESKGILIKAGTGAFAGHLVVGKDRSLDDQISLCVRVKTWLDNDQLGDDQSVLYEKGSPGDTLGDGWLQPRPFRCITAG